MDYQTVITRPIRRPAVIYPYAKAELSFWIDAVGAPALAGAPGGRLEGPVLLQPPSVGSYPQPEWLIDRARLSTQVPRVRADDLWRSKPSISKPAQGRRHHPRDPRQVAAPGLTSSPTASSSVRAYSNRFATALDGTVDVERPRYDGQRRTGKPIAVPRVVGPIRQLRGAARRACAILRVLPPTPAAPSRRRCPGPFTLTQTGAGRFTGDAEAMALDYAAALKSPRSRICSLPALTSSRSTSRR